MRLTDTDRAELCHRVDLAAMLTGDGVEVKRNGRAYVCKLRPDERTPSCHIYPPGTGTRGNRGWTFHDYGTDTGGDALAYLVDVRGMDYLDAARYMAEKAGWTPPSLGNGENNPAKRPTRAEPDRGKVTTPPSLAEPAKMDLERQKDAAGAFLLELLAVYPEAAAKGAEYLAGRGVLTADLPPMAYRLPVDVMPELCRRLAEGPDVALLTAAGLMKPPEDGKPLRLQWGPWAGDVLLVAHHDRDAVPAAFIARRINHRAGDAVGKYLQQTYSNGANRLPYGLLTLYRPAGIRWKPTRPELLVVEGCLDALGAARMGWAALAPGLRLRAADYTDRHGAAVLMLEPHLARLRDFARVLVIPDADAGDKGAEGLALAAPLVGWLRAAGCRADLLTVPELCPEAPPECKDLADVAATKGTP